MSKRDYYNIYERFESIREEIGEIKQTPISNIKDRIEILRKANVLLKEQNSLLLLRQSFFLESNHNSDAQQAV